MEASPLLVCVCVCERRTSFGRAHRTTLFKGNYVLDPCSCLCRRHADIIAPIHRLNIAKPMSGLYVFVATSFPHRSLDLVRSIAIPQCPLKYLGARDFNCKTASIWKVTLKCPHGHKWRAHPGARISGWGAGGRDAFSLCQGWCRWWIEFHWPVSFSSTIQRYKLSLEFYTHII